MCHLQKLYAKFNTKGLVVLGLNVSDDKKIALEMMADNNVTFPNILDSSDAATKVVFLDYQHGCGSAVPLSYIIDREGKIVAGWYGFEEGEPKALAAFQKVGGELAKDVRQAMTGKATNSVMTDALKAMKAAKKLTDKEKQEEPKTPK